MKKVNVGVIGLGQRGSGLMSTIIACKNACVAAVCDVYEDRRLAACKKVQERAGNTPEAFASVDEMLDSGLIDAVVISSSWETHVELAMKAMQKGIPTGLEVGGAYDVEACWELVRCYEQYKTPFMLLENCCFDNFELLATTLARRGMLGEIVHCHGAYSHDLRDEILGGNVNRHYRLNNYMKRNCDNYPTHSIGPIAKLLNINRGNKFNTLVSVASKSVGLSAYTTEPTNPDKSLVGTRFRQGDFIHTIITCANGETVTLTLDTTLPKYYSREFTVRGTKGLANQETNMIMIEGKEDMHCFFEPHQVVEKYLNNGKDYEEYMPELWVNITDEERKKGHGGMDFLMMRVFVDCVYNQLEMPIDIYDCATWMCITALSEQSIMLGGSPVVVPDFTRGKWTRRESQDVTKLKVE